MATGGRRHARTASIARNQPGSERFDWTRA